jgi:hypothetical protein
MQRNSNIIKENLKRWPVRTNFISVILTLIIALNYSSCSKADRKIDQAEWHGKIEYDAGVKIVKNPDEPVYGEIFFDLDEDLYLCLFDPIPNYRN